ncbi:porin family protein [Flavobacterium restrictum]|uniref:PorT family protein n=1 Tax=Flavobacterium restrictum TaxID=2594428 RepID=A0A553DV32_9FLAO|nr:porin family protein [Flavobacterium restrictum]TRX36655.1 PorT family protein [Flavobacterium restrictum]
MNRQILRACFFMLTACTAFSQEKIVSETDTKVKIDSLYREDQFYFSFTYNSLKNTPKDYSKNKFSTGFSGGFLRDMPINKKRTFAFATGIGLTYNNYVQNMAITGTSNLPSYAIIESTTSYSKNQFSQLLIDLPLELRWRTSTYESTKFWRIYGGIKCSYLVSDKSIYKSDLVNTTIKNNKDFNPFQYGVYLASGYNTLNVYAYYGLNSLFKSGQIAGESLQMKAFNLGVVFYIL